MPTQAELKQLANKPKQKIKKGDQVMIISGKDKGQKGTVIAVSPKEMKVMVARPSEENPDQWIPLNAQTKHYKPKRQGERGARYQKPGPIHISNVMLLDPKTGEPTRVGRRREGEKLVRYAKKSGTTIVESLDPDYVARKEKKD